MRWDFWDWPPNNLPAPRSFFEFPVSLLAFGRSLSSSRLAHCSGTWWRVTPSTATLIASYASGADLLRVLDDARRSYKTVKTLPMMPGVDLSGVPTKAGDPEWVFEPGAGLALDKIARRSVRRGVREFMLDRAVPPQAEALAVFRSWAESAKARHFQVVRGHYLAYLEELYTSPTANAHLWGVRDEEGRLVAITGWEQHHGAAQITVMKNLAGVSWALPRWWWASVLEAIRETSPGRIYAGSTADDLKESLGLTRVPTRKCKL